MFVMMNKWIACICLLMVPWIAAAEKGGSGTRTDFSFVTGGGFDLAELESTDVLSERWHEAVEQSDTPAVDITGLARIRMNRNGNDRDWLTDDRYKTAWNGGPDGWLEFELPEGQDCFGLYIRWGGDLSAFQTEVQDADGVWQPVGNVHPVRYYNDYIPVDGLHHFRIRNMGERDFCVTEVQFLSEGSVPDWVQIWQPFKGEADLLVLSAHPDDEVLWFGGAIPYYRGERQKKVLVVNVSKQPASRKCELLDCLWTCGVREYPIVTGGDVFVDGYASQTNMVLNWWGRENLLQFITGVIRRYRPLVAITHDFDGEYGHGAHKACAWGLTHALELAADPEYTLAGKNAGLKPWQIQKVYIHLYEENSVEMDWRVPLNAFDGKTGHEVACEAFKKHRTQDSGKYEVRDYGKHDNRLFGLYYSSVGPDEEKNDFFEHIEEERGIPEDDSVEQGI
ncbi:MAG: PIG-L family deacetylase [Clostridia bacterium]|nr:PIG-L family deacetylase [Clostridia bacterium]